MNREIKFRAWDEDRKKMIYKFGQQQPFEAPAILQTDEEPFRFFCGDYKENGDWQEPELMQYTGLKDKNGVDIYEGDILSKPDRLYMAKVEFEAPKFITRMMRPELRNQTSELRFLNEVEVIGNIYQNPDLIQ